AREDAFPKGAESGLERLERFGFRLRSQFPGEGGLGNHGGQLGLGAASNSNAPFDASFNLAWLRRCLRLFAALNFGTHLEGQAFSRIRKLPAPLAPATPVRGPRAAR